MGRDGLRQVVQGVTAVLAAVLLQGLLPRKALATEVVHKGNQVEADLHSLRFVIGFENHPLILRGQTLFDKQGQKSHRHIFPLRRQLIWLSIYECSFDGS